MSEWGGRDFEGGREGEMGESTGFFSEIDQNKFFSQHPQRNWPEVRFLG